MLHTDAMAAVDKTVRPAAVAGSWYPDDPQALQVYLTDLLAKATGEPLPADAGTIRAILVPHAGYSFSGSTAAASMRLLQGKSYKRVVVLGPAHRKAFPGLALPQVTHFQTPLGEIPLDLAVMERLSHQPLISPVAGAHEREHSIEAVLPFLQKVLSGTWQLVPVLVGQLGEKDFARAAQSLRDILDDETLLVISGDFTHYGPNYDFLPFPKNELTAENLEKLDMGAVARILANDAAGLIQYQRQTGITACAFGPMAVLLNLLPPDTQYHVVQYKTSGELTGNYTNSVSYFAMVATVGQASHPRKISPDDLSVEAMAMLHAMAKQAVFLAADKGADAVVADTIAAPFAMPSRFKEPSGAFVTLKIHGELRGCIGMIQPMQPLYQAVINNAVSATLRDNRFKPVQPGELPQIEMEVSVLSPMRAVASYAEFQVGEHGVVLAKNGRQAVYLPEVAVEQGWNREQTLTSLAIKAGLPADAWKSGASFALFTSQTYTKPLVNGGH